MAEKEDIFFAVREQLKAGFAPLWETHDAMLNKLAESIENSQEIFIRFLYDGFTLLDIDASFKATITISENSVLQECANHPSQLLLNTFLASHPEMSNLFLSIAVQAAAWRDLQNLYMLLYSSDPSSAYFEWLTQTKHGRYQVTVKGDMSHFYFSR